MHGRESFHLREPVVGLLARRHPVETVIECAVEPGDAIAVAGEGVLIVFCRADEAGNDVLVVVAGD